MDQVAAFYRTGMVMTVIMLIFVLLTFGALTVLGRERWLRLGTTESLLARLAAAVVLASIALGGLSTVVLNLIQGAAFSDLSLSAATSRNQTLLGIGLALAVSVVGIIRIEMYHRRFVNPPAQEEEEADWKMEPPEIAGRR